MADKTIYHREKSDCIGPCLCARVPSRWRDFSISIGTRPIADIYVYTSHFGFVMIEHAVASTLMRLPVAELSALRKVRAPTVTIVVAIPLVGKRRVRNPDSGFGAAGLHRVIPPAGLTRRNLSATA